MGHRHRARNPCHWPASSRKGHTGHIWGLPHWADTSSAHFPPHKAYLAGHLGCCSHSLWEGGLMNIGRLPQRGWRQKTCTRGAQPWKSTCLVAYLRPYPQGPFLPGSVWPCFWGLCPRLSLCRQNPGLNCAGLVHPPNVALCYEISLKSQGLSLCITWLTHKATVPSQPPGSLAAGPPTLAGTDQTHLPTQACAATCWRTVVQHTVPEAGLPLRRTLQGGPHAPPQLPGPSTHGGSPGGWQR